MMDVGEVPVTFSFCILVHFEVDAYFLGAGYVGGDPLAPFNCHHLLMLCSPTKEVIGAGVTTPTTPMMYKIPLKMKNIME